jgi:radical SAM superfamily enzyme YgiQ (UPF0313 family)
MIGPVRLGLLFPDGVDPVARQGELVPLAAGYFLSYLRLHAPFCATIIGRSVSELLDEGVDIIGIGATTERFDLAQRCARDIKARSCLPVIIGGIHISLMPGSFNRDMDLAVLGEGEETLCELVTAFARRDKRFVDEDLARIRGIMYRRGGVPVNTAPRPLIQPLDSLPLPDRGALWSGYKPDRAHLFTSRGCPYHCTFCASSRFWPGLRQFSADYVVREIAHIQREFGIREIHFFDDLFIVPRERLRGIVSLLEMQGLLGAIAFSGSVRANLVDDDLCELLNQLNCRQVGFGAESFSPRVLKYLKAGNTTPEQNQSAIDTLHRHGLEVDLSIIYGSPGEEEEDFKATFSALESNYAQGKIKRWARGNLRPYPGTPIWDLGVQKGVVSENMGWDDFAASRDFYFSPLSETRFQELKTEHEQVAALLRPDNAGLFSVWGLSWDAATAVATTLASLTQAPEAPFTGQEVEDRKDLALRRLEQGDLPGFMRATLDLLRYRDTLKVGLHLLAFHYHRTGEHAGLRAVLSLLADDPVVCFGDGFYAVENISGGRWMARNGAFTVRHLPGMPAGKMAFTLACHPQFKLYRTQSFRCEIWHNARPIVSCTFAENAGEFRVIVPLPAHEEAHVVTLSSTATFRPSEDGRSPDERDLSLMLRDVRFSQDIGQGRGVSDNGTVDIPALLVGGRHE